MKKIIAVIAAVLVLFSAFSFSSFAESSLQTMIQNEIDSSHQAGFKRADITISGRSYSESITITTYLGMEVNIHFNGASVEAFADNEVATINIIGYGTINIYDLTAVSTYNGRAISAPKTPAMRIYDTAQVNLYNCNLIGSQRNCILGNKSMGDAIEMMSPHCSLVARGCTLNGATGVDTTDDGAHEAAHCELYDTTVVGEKQDFITTYFGPIYDFIMNLINTILSLFGSGVSAILQ